MDKGSILLVWAQKNNEVSASLTPGACVFALVLSLDPRPRGREELKSFLALACSASIADSFSHFHPPSPETDPSRSESTRPGGLYMVK